MNLDDMSDGEINFKLWNLYAKIPKGHATICIYDYCNNWSDMGPLIDEHGLTNVWMNGYWVCHSLSKFGDDEEHNSESENPLRAAAICLIKKLEAENE